MLRDRLRPQPKTGFGPGLWRRRSLAIGVTGAAYLAAFAVLFWPRAVPPPPKPETSHPLEISFLPLPQPPGPPDDSQASAPAIATPPMPQVSEPTLTIAASPKPDRSDVLSASQLAGASQAGEGGGGGGGCDMARAVQQVLRRDPLVRAAVANANRQGEAVMVWNGDWVRSGDQEGKGLSAVREAIMWEVAFTPAACREQPMHGLVLLTLDGGTRFAVGSGTWRWSDLLGVRGAAAVR